MPDPNTYIDAQNLIEETSGTLDGNEQFVMFDNEHGKRATLNDMAQYIGVNTQADWNQTTTTAKDYIKNKPFVDVDTALSDTSTDPVQNKVVTEEFGRKAYSDGAYDLLYSGTAGNLATNIVNRESVPYNFRTSGGKLEVGSRKFEELEGGSLVWNQLANYSPGSGTTGGLSYTVNNDGSVVFSAGTSTGVVGLNSVTFTGKLSHVLYIAGCPSGGADGKYYVRDGYQSGSSALDIGNGRIVKKTQSDSLTCQIYINSGVTIPNLTFRPQLFDLTAMFGSEIADYIYGLEQATPGAGVAWFRKYFPKPYYGYKAPGMEHVNVSAMKTTGFNQWDEEWEPGYYSPTTGARNPDARFIKSKNLIGVFPSTNYFIDSSNVAMEILEWDASKNFLRRLHNSITDAAFVTSPDAYYIGIGSHVEDAMRSYDPNTKPICINLSWDGSEDGSYEPYDEHTYPLDSTVQLRGIPKLDDDGNLAYDGDIYTSDGEVTRRYGVKDLSTLNWIYNSTRGAFIADVSGAKLSNDIESICSQLTYKKGSWFESINDKEYFFSVAFRTVNLNAICVKYTATTDPTAFAAAMSGVYLIYELATPTTETAAKYSNPQIISNWGTEEFIDAGVEAETRDVAIPVGHNTDYMADLKADLELMAKGPYDDGAYYVQHKDGKNTYQELKGEFDDVTTGGAKQLISNTYEEDSVPYNLHTSGGAIDIGDRKYMDIVGGSLPWNQLIKDPVPTALGNGWNKNRTDDIVSISDGIMEITSSAMYGGIQNAGMRIANANYDNHVILVSAEIKSDAQITDGLQITYGDNYYFTDYKTVTVNDIWKEYSAIFLPQTVRTAQAYVSIRDIRSSNFTSFYVRNVKCFDLTAMFGDTIARYIRSLHQATYGEGLAWFKKLFPKPYYDYTPVEMLHVKTSEHKTTGFNQWDEEWEVGLYYVADGQKGSASNVIRTKNMIPILPNTAYHKQSSSPGFYWNLYYDANKNYISYAGVGYANNFTTPANAYYMTTYTESGYGSTYKNDLCINLHWDGERDGEYEPYVEHSYPLDPDLELRGIPKLDSSNNLYFDGDIYKSDGTVMRRFGIVDLGTLSWSYGSSIKLFYCTISDIKRDTTNLILPKNYEHYPLSGNGNDPDKKWHVYTTTFYISDSSYTDAATFKTAMSGVYLVYELATPITEEAQPYTNPMIVDDWGTEEFVDERDVAIPVGHNSKYTPNLRAKLEMAPNSPDGNGDYIVRQTNGTNEYVPLVIPKELPDAPSANGTYKLQVTVSNGTPTYSWVSS